MEDLEESPVTATQIKMWTRRDPLLSRVSRYFHEGWPDQCDDQLKPYWSRKTELLSMMTLYFGEAASSATSRPRGGARRATCQTSWHFLNEDFGKNVCVVAQYGWRHSEDSSVVSHLPTVQASPSFNSSTTMEVALPSLVTLALGLCWTIPWPHISSGC